MRYIGIFPRVCETLFFSFPQGIVPFYLVAKNSREEAWVKQFLPTSKILSYEIAKKFGNTSQQTTLTILKHATVLQLLRAHTISHILLTIVPSKKREIWAKKHGIICIPADSEKKQQYENKIWFDSFLEKHAIPKPRSFIYTYKKDKYVIPLQGKIVLQIPTSLGHTGTFILENIHEVDLLLKKKIIQSGKQYLIREYITGKSYGVDLFISSSTIVFSQARLQCFYHHAGKKRFTFFNGVQFISSSSFSENLKKKITHIFTELGTYLYKNAYMGYAGIDFIVDAQENIFILECNARFTTSSPLLLRFPETFSHVLTSKIFIEDFFHPQKCANTYTLFPFPESTFSGSILRLLLYPESKKKRIVLTKEFPIGLYAFTQNAIIYLGPDIRKLDKTKEQFVYYCDMKKGQTYKPTTYIADIFSTFPLYDCNGKLNGKGKMLTNYFQL